jgi:hypothetical protein
MARYLDTWKPWSSRLWRKLGRNGSSFILPLSVLTDRFDHGHSGHIPMTPVMSALHQIKPLTAFRSQLLKVGTHLKTGSCLSSLASGSRGALVKASLTQALCTQTGHLLGAPLLRSTCSRRRYGLVCSLIELRI